MTKKGMIAELERRLRLYEEYREHWQNEVANATDENKLYHATVLREYYKGKSHATVEAIKIITGEA